MRKTCLSIFFALFATIFTLATPVTPEKARSVALKYLNCSSVALRSDSFTLLGTKASALDSPAFYVFNNPDGSWVMVSGEDTTIPILAAGDGSIFETEDMPEHVKYWMDRISSTVKNIRKDASVKQSEQIKALWANPRPSGMNAATSEVYLETPSWNQRSPYNDKCPLYDGTNRAVTGCVATAMAEVLRYHSYPEKGKGVIPAYTTSKHSLAMPAIDIDGFEYDWTIPFKYKSSTWSTEQKEAVADLMLHCGCMVEMNYGSSSGAYETLIPGALSTYMGYSKAACMRYRAFDSPMGWLKLLKKELDEGRPIIYAGSNINGSGAHCFVCDGYNSNNQVHINFGWGGSSNGWYAVNYLGKSGGSVYSKSDDAVIGLAPDPEGDDEKDKPLMYISYSSKPDSTKGFTITSGSINSKSFKLKLDAFFNRSGYTYTGKYKICLAGEDDTIISTLSTVRKANISNGYLYENLTFSCTIPSTVTPSLGNYIALFYDDPYGNWIRAKRYYTSSALKNLDKLNPFDFSIITIPANIKAGNVIYPEVLHRNVRLNSETWKLDGNELDILNFTATAGEHTLEVKLEYTDGSSETVKKKFTVN